jgi:hypothetical protein
MLFQIGTLKFQKNMTCDIKNTIYSGYLGIMYHVVENGKLTIPLNRPIVRAG